MRWSIASAFLIFKKQQGIALSDALLFFRQNQQMLNGFI